MKIYQKKILKFCPDLVIGEFINLGLFFFDAKSKSFCFGVVEEERVKKRIEVVFPNFSDVSLTINNLVQIEKNLLKLKMLDFSHHTTLDSIIKHYVMPIDDAALFFSETSTGLYPEEKSLNLVLNQAWFRYFSYELKFCP